MRHSPIILVLLLTHQFMWGQSITPLGLGLTLRGTIYDIAIDESNDQYYAVGDFSGIDGIKMKKVGLNKNGIWSSIPDSTQVEGVILCSEVYNGELYIGGNFSMNSSSEIINLARLENGVWQPMGIKHMSGSIRDLTWFDGELYITGDFRSVNAIKNMGIMKYSNGQWKDSGLNSDLNARSVFVKGDTLFAWGNGFNGNADFSHTVSFFTNQTWKSLPKYYNRQSVSGSCQIYKGSIFSTEGEFLYRFNGNTNKWESITTLPSTANNAILFEHQGELCLVADNSTIYRLIDGAFELMEFQTIKDYRFENINSVKSLNGNILVGGNFQHWDSKSVSIALIESDDIIGLGKVWSNLGYRNSWSASHASSIVRYNNKLVIAGRFSFADGIYSPNIVYWDGSEFSAFDVPLPSSIGQLEVFENELYAMSGGKLVKYDGEKWEVIITPVEADKINIVNDKLFVLSDFYHDSQDGGPFYLQNSIWKELIPLEVTDGIPWYRYREIRSYKGGYIMSINHFPGGEQLAYLSHDTSDWVILDTLNVRFDNIRTLNDRIFLISDWVPIVYELKNGNANAIGSGFNLATNNPFFFKLQDKIHFSAVNGSTYRFTEHDTLEFYSQLRVRDIEKISDEKYLVALQSTGVDVGLERITLNHVGILNIEPFNAEIKKDHEIGCANNYVQFWPKTNHFNTSYHWEFEGGTPTSSSSVFPMIKYSTPGIYKSTLKITNLEKDTLQLSTNVEITNCTLPSPRANNHDNHWVFGYEYWADRGIGGFDFTFPDTVIAPRYLSKVELNSGSITMSDAKGKLQFYSNGKTIMNMNNQPIAGSECFNSELEDYPLDYYIANQSILCLPAVGDENKYHIFDLDPLIVSGERWLAGSNLSMTTIDMSRNSGLGEVIECNLEIVSDVLLNSTMQATRHANGIDWWILVGKNKSDEYYKLLLTANGIESVETSIWHKKYNETFSGQSTFSPDGNYFAQVIKENQQVSIWRFDNTSGELSDLQTYSILPLDETEYPQGCSFSPNSRFLYISSLTQLRQIDLCDFNAIEVELIDSWDGSFEFIYPLYFGKQMLNPNQNIIVTPYGNSHWSFGVIDAPNEKGINCNFKQHSIQTSELTRNKADVIPIFPHFRNYPSDTSSCGKTAIITTRPSLDFSIFPNPIITGITLHFSHSTAGSIYTLNGNKVYTFSKSDHLDVNSLIPGTYLIKTAFGTHQFVKL